MNNREPLHIRWGRRLLTYPAVYLSFVVGWGLAPVVIVLTLLTDLARRSSFGATRAYFFLLLYVTAQAWGLIALFLLWLFSGTWLVPSGVERCHRWYYWIQLKWAGFLIDNGLRIWGMKTKIDSDYEFTDRPVILMVRHASLVDTFLPIFYPIIPMHKYYWYVMKNELRWDPCIELALNHLSHIFVRRGSEDSRKEVEKIGNMIVDAPPNHGVVIFCEGTRFSPAKQERIRNKLRKSGDERMFAYAERFRWVLPPRMGGPLALLRNNTNADIVFCAHTGLEKSSSFREAFNGGLAQTTLQIKLWGVRYEDIPEADEDREQMLLDEWLKVDAFIDQHRKP